MQWLHCFVDAAIVTQQQQQCFQGNWFPEGPLEHRVETDWERKETTLKPQQPIVKLGGEPAFACKSSQACHGAKTPVPGI